MPLMSQLAPDTNAALHYQQQCAAAYMDVHLHAHHLTALAPCLAAS